MENKIDNSKEAAFASCMFDASSGATLINNGLTKREYFAGLAMQGILSNPRFFETENSDFLVNGFDLNLTVISKSATLQADELLKTLEKNG